jgi:translation initiation factor IF-2
MAGTRVHELAKELNVSNKDLIDRLLKLGIQVKNHFSTLSDSAVQQIRDHFDTARAEVVEEKRIGRTFIRRRKRVVMDEIVPVTDEAGLAAEVAEPQVGEAGILPEEAAFGPGAAVPAETPTAPAETASVATEPVSTPPADKLREDELPTEFAAEAPSPLEEAALSEEELAVAPGAEPAARRAETVAPVSRDLDKQRPKRTEEAAVIVTPAPSAEERAAAKERAAAEVRAAAEAYRVEAGLVPPRVTEASPTAVPLGEPDEKVRVSKEVIDDSLAEEEGEGKPKKAKKRRRKKTRKDEPARIIKLPDLISEEPEVEEEPELPTPVARRVLVPEEEAGAALLRKKKPKLAEAEVKPPERKRTATGSRKEVVEREALYSKKELAAQADRERGRGKGKTPSLKEARKTEITTPKAIKRRIKIDEAITLSSLARQMGVKAGELIKKLLLLGLPASINQAIDFETAALLAVDFDFEVEKAGFEEEGILQMQEDRPEDLLIRPPVITVMGHVDHGKTSLLDAIRHTNVIGGEAGGITQHIGAYYVKLEHGEVVFLDTPGHEAFTAMRARGAKVTDIVILVVAADDGVMQQTVEAINHAKAAQVPIIVAINKIDKPNANLERVKRELAEHGLLSGEWGGDVTMVEVSAKKRIGIEELLEMVLLQAEMMELKANPVKAARGHVIEAKLDKGRGPIATILIQEGTLKAGDVYVCGVHSGRVRSMYNDRGQRLEQALPSVPVEVVGFSGVPNAGDEFVVLTDEKQAKVVAEHRLARVREKELSRTTKVTLEKLYEQIREGAIKELNVIVRTDVQGSLEAIIESLVKLSTAEVKVNVIHSATGAITETDIMLASASNAIIIGFNVRADAKVEELAEQEKVDVRYYDVIYQILSDIRDAMVGMLEPVYQENVMGRAEVRQVFTVPKIGAVAGCWVLDGRVERSGKVRVLRDQVVVYDGRIGSLRRFKDDVKEVKAGFECGIGVENFNDIKVNDILEVYQLLEVKPTLESSEPGKG